MIPRVEQLPKGETVGGGKKMRRHRGVKYDMRAAVREVDGGGILIGLFAGQRPHLANIP